MTSLNSHSWLMVPSPGSCTAPREVVPVSPHRFQTLGSTQHKLPTSEAGDTSSPAHPSVTAGRAQQGQRKDTCPCHASLDPSGSTEPSVTHRTNSSKQSCRDARRSGEHEPLGTRRAGKDRGYVWSRAHPIPSQLHVQPSPDTSPRGALKWGEGGK